MTDIELPIVVNGTAAVLEQLTTALGVPREILAGDDEIRHAWESLPRELSRIPRERWSDQLAQLLARMCVAVATGLFDSAINYAWNAAILELRNRVRAFGLHVVSQIEGKSFDERTLLELRDAELLSLCVRLNLIDENAFFFLDQCREVRNNFSAAHPPIGDLDDTELVLFVSRCFRHALASTVNPRGVDITAFLQAIKRGTFSGSQEVEWKERIAETHEAQREAIFGTLHGIFCDPASSEETRLNALAILAGSANRLTPKIKAQFVDRHSEYLAKGQTDRHIASRQLFERIGLLGLLSETERHAIISHACKRLLSVHQGFNNFYNEPPFAERLLELSRQGPIPESVQSSYVEVVVTCAVGSQYGVSWGAERFYKEMVQNFSPREVADMLETPDGTGLLAERIKQEPECRKRFSALVRLISPESVLTSHIKIYERWSKLN